MPRTICIQAARGITANAAKAIAAVPTASQLPAIRSTWTPEILVLYRASVRAPARTMEAKWAARNPLPSGQADSCSEIWSNVVLLFRYPNVTKSAAKPTMHRRIQGPQAAINLSSPPRSASSAPSAATEMTSSSATKRTASARRRMKMPKRWKPAGKRDAFSGTPRATARPRVRSGKR